MMCVNEACPVCGNEASLLDVVDLNRSCEEARGRFLPLAQVPIHYYVCAQCGFCFAPEMHRWPLDEFEERIYNDDYLELDPDYTGARPEANARALTEMFGERAAGIRHLDYGGGHGLLSDLMRDAGWASSSYDPFVQRDVGINDLGTFDLITAYEVFEHVPDVNGLVSNLAALLASNGVILFTTLVSDGHIREHQPLDWWYAAPRNGHISLHSRTSLRLLGTKGGFKFGSFSDLLHAYWRQVPAWAAHVLREA